ncbi:hypothetical protein UFOVP291_32 [uncultured Caudovirales phage]|uniref:Uncharacterized protein n=1 Tax=uncultured Caudovirales phage TaxID=2100421 RepID=A0A6J5LR51_9CAUD|nr:hypothetical protein UFOVP291_32 [uncultured Caudovirales phage]
MNENFWEQAPLVDQPANKPAKNFWDDAPIAVDGMDAAPAPAPLPSAGLGTFGTSVGKSYNEFNVQKGLADRVRIEGMLQELNAGGNPDINPVKTWGAGIKFDIGRALGANVDAPEVKRQYLLNRMGEIDNEIKSSGAAVQAAGPGSQQLSDLQASLQEAQKQDSFLSKTGATFSALKESPGGIPELIGGGAYTMGRPIAAGIGAAAVSQGSSLIPMAASALVSGADSYDGTMAEIIEQKGREGGIDVRKNPEVIPTLLQDAGFIEAAKGEALRRGISDAAWSAISMRLGMSPKIKGVWQPIVQSAAEVGTEITGQLARKGEVYDPTALPVAGVTGFAFEGPSYALGRAAGAFGKATPPPAAPGPQAQQSPAPTPVAPQPINAEDLPSVAGETVEAPVAPVPAPASVQPELPVQPAAQPQAVAPAPVAVQPVAAQPEPIRDSRTANDASVAETTKTKADAEYIAWLDDKYARKQIDENSYRNLRRLVEGVEQPANPAAPAPAAVQPEPTPAPAPQPVATAKPEAKPVAPVAQAAQTEIPGTAETFNLTGEQVATPAPKAVDTTAEMPLPETRENPLATEARARLAKLESAGKGDSDQANALRRTIERESKPAQPAARAEPEVQTEPAPIPSTPERESKINAILDNAEAADQSYTYEIKPIYQLKGSDGKWYRPQGFPFGVKNTGEKRIEGYAAHSKEGISYGKTYATEAEANAAAEAGRKARREEFRKSLGQSDDARLNDQAKFWEGERATFDRRNPEAAARRQKPAQPNPRTDAEISPPQSPQAEAAPVAEAGYVVRIGKREYKVGSLAEASKKWMDVQEEIDNQGLSWNKSQEFADIPNPTILDSSGKQIGWISQNGTIADGVPGKPKNKLFDPYAEPVAEAAPVEQPKANIDAEYEAAAATKKLANIDPLVKQEATRQGFTIGPVYHGTPTGGFNKFDPNRTGSNAGVSRGGPSFTTNQEAAEAYSETMRPEDRAIAELVAKANEIFATIPEDAPGEVYEGTPVGEIRFDTNATDDLSAGISGLEGHADELRKAGYPEQAAKLEALAKEDFEGGKPEVKAVFLRLSGKPREITTTRAKMAEDLKGVRATADAPVVVNLEDGETVYYVGNPNDIKSADAIVRDDAGKVVPLSRRFQESDDIRGAVESAQAAKQPKKEAKPAKARDKKPDAKTGEPYEVALARRRVDNPKTNRSRYIEAVRVLDQYENDQKLADYDKTVDLDKSSDEAITEFLDAHSSRPEYEVSKAESDYADAVSRYAEKRFGSETGQRGDLLADMRDLAKKGVALPVLPKWMKAESGRTFADILAGKIPGALTYPPLLKADEKRAKTDPEFRKEIKIQFEGMAEKYAQSLSELGWTQVAVEKAGFDELVDLIGRAADGEKLVPQGGVQSFRKSKEGNPRAYSTGPNANVNPDVNQQTDEGMDTREPEPTEQQKQFMVDLEAEYGDPRFDSTPTPAEQAILDAASDNMPTEESILDALDKAAAERLDPKNRSSIGPDLIAAVMWQTARDIQKGVVSFAKWAADTARNFPSLKGSLKTIWAKAQDIAKRPIDYIRFRALDTIADKVWQNVRRNKGSETLRKIANIVFAKGGPDADAVDNDIPTRVNLVRTQFSNIYASIMERFAADFADMTPEQRRQWDTDFRKHVIDGTTPSDPKLAKAVKDFRNLMRDLLAYQRDAGIEMGDQGVNYFPRNYDPDAVEANRPSFVKAAIEMYRRMGERMYAKIMAEPITQEQIDTRAESLKDKDDKAGTALRSDDEYKRIAEIQLEQTRQERADKYNFSPDDLLQKAEDWATAITHGDVLGLTLFKASEGKITSDATDARKFSNDEAKLADEFLKKNVDDIMLGYIDGAVRGAELARVFGEDGKMFEQMMNKLSKEGVDAETIKETRRLVQKALGVGREQASQATAVFFDWVNVVLAGAFLGKTAIYNLVLEPISFGIRTGNAYLAIKSMADTWRYAIAEIGTPSAATRQRLEAKYGSRFNFEKAVTETVGEQVGLIQREMERAYLNSHWDYSSGEKGSKMAKWISQRIYRANLMSATEKAKVQASIGIARLALRDNARFLAGTAPIQKLFKALGFDTNAEKSAAVIMRENGVPEADHKAFAAFVEGLEGKTDAEWQAAVLDPKNKMAKHYRRALQRMSLGMSIKTNPALKMEMSDSVLGRMLMQLMNYSYAYSNLIKDRMYSMAAQTVAKDASKIDRLRYAAPLMVGAPLAVLAAVGSKALISAMWPSDEMEEINKKKAAARKAFDAASFAGMFGPKIEYLVKGFERGQTPGGPVAETVFRGGQAAFAAASDPESAKKIYNAKKQAYSSTVKPLVTGAGAAVHPFFGFLGNVAVNKQEVREAVIGDKPKK